MQNAAIGIVKDGDLILWVKRRDVPVWVLPGGGIDPGETAEDAVVREVFEESGLEVRIIKKTAEYSPINRWTAETHVFICEIEGGVLGLSNESDDCSFFPADAPPPLFFPLHLNWLKESLETKKLIKRPLTDFTWKKVLKFLLNHPIIFFKYLKTIYSHK